jgi:hypothetical protein
VASAIVSIFDALTLSNARYFESAGVEDFTTERCVRDYDWPEALELTEYLLIGTDKAGNIEETLKMGSDESTILSSEKVSEEVDETEEVTKTEEPEVVIPNHIIM